ncbi:MAG: hypothetical protein LC797_11470 [Chloroflexi bacterium]|nr:hypothetical protein [Chloroflexota bacterium]
MFGHEALRRPYARQCALTLIRIAGWLLLVVGLGLTVLGAALVLNFASLRELVEQTRFHPAIEAVFAMRDEMSHRRAQSLELASGVSGAALFVLGVWVLRRPETR